MLRMTVGMARDSLRFWRSMQRILISTSEALSRGNPCCESSMASPVVIVLPSLSRWSAYSCQVQSRRGFAAAVTGAPRLTPAVERQLDRICQRHEQLLEDVGGDNLSRLSPQDIARLNKELSDLQPVVDALEELRGLQGELRGLQALVDDAVEEEEMKALAREEREQLAHRLPELEQRLLLSLLPRDDADSRGVVLEVRAGTGGEEASLFAMDLFRMYERYTDLKGWKFEVVEMAGTDVGGCKLASATISGGGVYGRLKFESGIHRVQRVPATESGGRVHTSAASVAVLPQAEDVDVLIREEDIRVDVYRAGGAGGQHVNTTNSAVRVTHLPSGLVVAIQDERSQHKNKAKALKVLRARLFDAERLRAQQSLSRERREQIGSGDRSERIRTYNFPQGRVTDHRVGVTEHGIEGVLAGERLDSLIEALQLQHQTRLLANLDAA